MKSKLLIIAAMATFNVGANQSLRDDAILVDDIGYKLAAGFKADDVVYKLPEAQLGMSDDEMFKANVEGGITTTRNSLVAGEGRGRESDFAYNSSGLGDIHHVGGDNFFDFQLDIPNGDEFTFVRVWGSDTNGTEDLSFFVFERCLPGFGAGSITSTTLVSGDSTGSGGDFSFALSIPADTFVDTTDCIYTLRARFDVTDSTLRLYKVRSQSDSVAP